MIYKLSCYNNKIWVTYHKDKMSKIESLYSISTSSLMNEFCLRMHRIKNTICNECYGIRAEKVRKSLENKLVWNYNIFSSPLYDLELPEFVSDSVVRFDSFGELFSTIQLGNYVRICELNSNSIFTLFSKRYDLIFKFFESYRKPDNLIIVLSSLLLNKRAKRKKYIDKVFTCTSNTSINNVLVKKHNSSIECQKKCKNCMQCYLLNSKVRNIFEVKR
jgi:hypothetical protein